MGLKEKNNIGSGKGFAQVLSTQDTHKKIIPRGVGRKKTIML